jgi:hypothetical protein
MKDSDKNKFHFMQNFIENMIKKNIKMLDIKFIFYYICIM